MAEKKGQISTVEEMFARYPDEWILFDVAEYDQYERPSKGILVAHHPDRKVMEKVAKQTKFSSGALFYSGPIVPQDREVIPWLIASPSSASNTASSSLMAGSLALEVTGT